MKEVIAKPAHPRHICELVSKTIDELKQVEPAPRKPALQKTVKAHPNTKPRQRGSDTSYLVWQVAKKFQPQAVARCQLLVVGKTEPNSRVRGNTMQVRQALQILVRNVINNTPKGGTVVLSSGIEANRVKIVVRGSGGRHGDHV